MTADPITRPGFGQLQGDQSSRGPLAGIAAEFVKLFTLRMWWILGLVAIVYVGGIAAIYAFVVQTITSASGGESGGMSLGYTTAADWASFVYESAPGVGFVLPLLLGVMAVTGEYRSGTISITFMSRPQRWTVLVDKAVALFVVGAGMGVVALAAAIGIGGAVLLSTGHELALDDPTVLAQLLRSVMAMGIWAALGVAVGALLHSQALAIVIVLVFTQLVEPILSGVASVWDWSRELAKYLPGAASAAFVDAYDMTQAVAAGGAGDRLDWWLGALVLLGMVIVLMVIAAFTTWRSDVATSE